jgi:D-sedoheptulose 7-phosphate isomerase
MGLATKNDIVIGISTSGKSLNVINGLKAAKKIGALTVVFTGKGGKKLESLADFCIIIPSYDTQRIQECHILLIHMLCGVLEISLENKKK